MSDVKYAPAVIVGGGLTGLSLAAGLDRAGVGFVLLERSERLGGQIRTIREQGFTYEVGPNTGTVSTPEVAELFEYASPEASLVTARPEANSRWIWKGDRFHAIPSGIISGLRTPLYTWKDKLGIPLEPFRRRGTDPNESVGALAERRLGKSIVDYTIDPFIGGIYAGDPYRLVTRFALPKLYNLEQKYGSFIGGSIRKSREPKSERERKATKKIFNAEGGLERLVEAIGRKITRHGEVILGALGIRIEPTDGEPHRFRITYEEGGTKRVVTCDHVVTTVRADLLPGLFPPEWVGRFDTIVTTPYAPITEVVVGFEHLPGVPRNAFGALVPSREQRKILGILFPGSCFEGRVPYEDGALFTIFMGGERNRDLFFASSKEEQARDALEELYAMMKIPMEHRPDLVHVERYEKAIPQYDHGTENRLEEIRRLEESHPGLYIAGGVRDGIGMANRIAQGMQIARSIDLEMSK